VKSEENIQTFLKVRDKMDSECWVMVSFAKNKGVAQDEAIAFGEKRLLVTDGAIFYNVVEMLHGNSHFDEINDVAREMTKKAGGGWPCLDSFQETYIVPEGGVYYCCESIAKLAFEQLESVGDFSRGRYLRSGEVACFTRSGGSDYERP